MSTTTKTDVSSTLQHVVDATLGPQGYAFVSSQAVRDILLTHPGAISVDTNTRDVHHNVAVRATQEGILAAFGGPQESDEAHVSTASKTRFKIEDGYEIPAPKRGIQAEPRYPFNLLNVGQSFMVPATPERPNPAKALASTVSSANKRMSGQKKFIIRPVEGGARVWRIE